MLAQERQEIIHDMLIDQRIVKISDISKKFGISNMTARRDLDVLWDQGIARRVYGGAILIEQGENAHFQSEPNEHKHSTKIEVAAIAKKAASLIEKGDNILLGNGPITKEIAKNIRKIPNLTIVTSSLLVVNELIHKTDNKIYILGGLIDTLEERISGMSALKMLHDFCMNKTFLSCEGITLKNGVTTSNTQGAELGRICVENADKTFIVAHSQVFGISALNKVCSLSEVTSIITDNNLPDQKRKLLEKANIDIISASSPDAEFQ